MKLAPTCLLVLGSCTQYPEFKVSSCGEPPRTTMVYGGSPASSLSAMTPEQARSIVAVRNDAREGLCTGVVVGTNTAITAKHCVVSGSSGDSTTQPSELTIAFGVSPDTSFETVVHRVSLHPTLDVAQLEFLPFEQSHPAVPIPLSPNGLAEEWLGSAVELAGFGETEDLKFGSLRFVVEPIAEYTAEHVVVDGRGKTGACVGDSGGPLIARNDDGRLSVVGILDAGNSFCVGRDYYTRSDLFAEWVGPETASTRSCDGVDSEGFCLRGRAIWCDTDQLTASECQGSGQICGWSTESMGFRCVAPEKDPCQGSGSTRVCTGDAVTGCSRGEWITTQCGPCTTCQDWFDARGAGCVAID